MDLDLLIMLGSIGLAILIDMARPKARKNDNALVLEQIRDVGAQELMGPPRLHRDGRLLCVIGCGQRYDVKCEAEAEQLIERMRNELRSYLAGNPAPFPRDAVTDAMLAHAEALRKAQDIGGSIPWVVELMATHRAPVRRKITTTTRAWLTPVQPQNAAPGPALQPIPRT